MLRAYPNTQIFVLLSAKIFPGFKVNPQNLKNHHQIQQKSRNIYELTICEPNFL